MCTKYKCARTKMSVTLFTEPKYSGTTAQIAYETATRQNTNEYLLPKVISNDNLSSFQLDSGYRFCMYRNKDVTKNSDYICADGSIEALEPGEDGWDDKVTRARLLKYCDDPKWNWDAECNRVKPCPSCHSCQGSGQKCSCHSPETPFMCPYSSETKQKENRIKECNSTEADGCYEFCTKHPGECTDYIRNYCTKRPEDGICRYLTQDSRMLQECADPSRLESNEVCQSLCISSSNIKQCETAIKKLCRGDKIRKLQFCRDALSKRELWGTHDAEMTKYCNDSRNRSDALCGCLLREKIRKHFESVPDRRARELLISRPDCFYPECTATGVYKPAINAQCPSVTVCTNVVEKLILTENAKTNLIKQTNNCGDGGGDGDDDDDSSTDSSKTDNKSILIWVALAVIVCICVICMVMLTWGIFIMA